MSGAAQSGRVGGASLPTYVVGGGVSADYSAVTVDATMTADGVDTSTVTITAIWQMFPDGAYVPMPDVASSEIVVAVSGSNNTITQPTAKTNASGVTTASFTTTTAETKTVTVRIRGRLLVQTGACIAGGGAPPTTLFSHQFADSTYGGLATYQVTPGIVTDATALSGKSVQLDWTSGAEYAQIISFPPATSYKKLYIRIHYKQDATADNSGIKKTIRFRGNVGGVGGKALGTFNIQSGRFLFYGDDYGNGQNENQTGYLGSDPIFVDNKPDTLRSTWRYLEMMVDYTDTAKQVASMWIDGTLIISRDLAISPSIDSSAYFEKIWVFSTFNSPKDNRSEWLGEVVVSTAVIGMP